MHLFVRILYGSHLRHLKRQQGGGGLRTLTDVNGRTRTIAGAMITYNMSSNIKIERICEFCGQRFMAQTTVTRFCSKRCAERSYKDRMRQRKMALSHQETSKVSASGKYKDKDFLTPSETAMYLGVCRTFVYDSINRGQIKVRRMGRKTLICKADLHDMFGFLQPVSGTSDTPVEKKPKSLDDFYTRADIREKFGVKDSWIYKVVAENNVPKTIIRGKAYFSKSHIDRIFSAKKNDPAITEWYTVEDIQNKYGMTLSAIYCLVSKIGIPKKKENGRTFYSKYHFDVAKGTASAEEEEFISVADAMAKYTVTRDQLYHYVKTYKVNKLRCGRYIKLNAKELEAIFNPSIEL